MGSLEAAVQMTLAFEDVREFQLQWDGVISAGSCFVPWPRPLNSDLPVRLTVTVAGAGTAEVDATVDYNDVDSFGRNGALLKLGPKAVESLQVVFQKSSGPPRPSAPTLQAVQKVAASLAVPPADPGQSAWPATSGLALTELALDLPPVEKLAPVILTGETLPEEPEVTEKPQPPPPPAPVAPAAPIALKPLPPVLAAAAMMAKSVPTPAPSSPPPPLPVATPTGAAPSASANAATASGASNVSAPAAPSPAAASAGAPPVLAPTPDSASSKPAVAVPPPPPPLPLPAAAAAPSAAPLVLSPVPAAPPPLPTPAAAPPVLSPSAATTPSAAPPVLAPIQDTSGSKPAVPAAAAALAELSPSAATTPSAAPPVLAPIQDASSSKPPVPTAAAAPPVLSPSAATTPSAAPPVLAPIQDTSSSKPPVPTPPPPLPAPVAGPVTTSAASPVLPPSGALPPNPLSSPPAPPPVFTPVAPMTSSASTPASMNAALDALATDPHAPSAIASTSAASTPVVAPPAPPTPAANSSDIAGPPRLVPVPPAPSDVTPAAASLASSKEIPVLSAAPVAALPANAALDTSPAIAEQPRPAINPSPQPPPQPLSESPTLPPLPQELFAATHLRSSSPTANDVPDLSGGPPVLQPMGDRLEPGYLLDNRFQIESHLATGGMGDVYRAAHVFLKRPVALKLLKKGFAADPEMWARFQREAEMVSQLESQHIVRVFDFGRTSSGMPFLAMEFVQGHTLDALIKDGPLSPERTVEMICQVCDGLGEAHGIGIVHRDLKPQNIIVGKRRDGTEIAKILDFGIARIADAQQAGAGLTQMGMVVGTPAYLAPEQALADTLDARTDVYALGCVIFELLVGRPPFAADSLQKLLAMHLKDAPPSPVSLRKDIPVALGEVVLKALAKDRNHRWQNVKELQQALRKSVDKIAPASSAFDDWAAESKPSKEAEWPPPPDLSPSTSGANGAADSEWPPASEKAAASAPAPAPAKPEVDSFFAMDAGAAPAVEAPKAKGKPDPVKQLHRLESAVEKLKISLPQNFIERMVNQRSGLEAGTRKLAMLHVEVLRVPPEKRGVALAQVLISGMEHEGVVDALDEDGVTFMFHGEDALVPAVRALHSGLYARETVPDAVAGATIRAACTFGKVTSSDADEPLGGEIPVRARTLCGKAGPGKIVVESKITADVQDAVALENPGNEVTEVGGRRQLLHQVPTLFGRDAVLAALDKQLKSLSQTATQPILIKGDSGSGRTTIAQELGVRARHQRAVVGNARGLPSVKNQPYAALGELLSNICGVSKDQRIQKLPPALEALKLSATDFEAALVIAGVRHVPQPFTAGQAVYALRAVLNSGAAGRKVLLIFDGLEQMDSLSVDAFKELCAHPAPRELTVGLCDTSFAAERFESMSALELGGLNPAESTAMLSAWLGGAPLSERVVDTIHRRGRGLPGLMLDWLQLLADRAYLRFKSGAYVLASDPPGLNDEELARERVKALWPEAMRLFEAVCIAGDNIDGAVLNATLPNIPQPAYQRLVTSRLVRALGGRRWTAASERHRQQGLALESKARPQLHQRLAGAMAEAAKAMQLQPDAFSIAQHLTLSKDATRAIQLWRTVLDSALKRRAPKEVLPGLRGLADALTVLIEQTGPRPEITRAKVEALARAADHAVACGEPLNARTLVDEAQTAATAYSVESFELALAQARVFRSEARRSKATEAIELALKLSKGTALSALAYAERGEALEADGDLPGAGTAFSNALQHADAAQELARWHGEVDFRARVETRLAGVLLAQKNVAAAKQHYRNALSAWEKAVYPYAEARVLANMGALHVQSKEFEEAARFFKEAAAAAGKSGDVLFQARQLLNLAKVAKRFDANQVGRQAAEVAKRLATLINWEEGKVQAASLTDGK